MRRLSLFFLIAIFLMFTACSSSPNSGIVIPLWLQGQWYATDGSQYKLVFDRNNIMVYENGKLEIDFKSNLQLYPNVEIENQGSTDTTYQLTLINTSSRQHMYITVRYTESTDTIIFTNSDGYSSLRIPATRL